MIVCTEAPKGEMCCSLRGEKGRLVAEEMAYCECN